MDDGGHRENGRRRVDHYQKAQSQWLMQHQPSMKQLMAIMAERDAAIQERNLALSEIKQALAERDMAVMQLDTAIGERNNAQMERDNALATPQYRDNSMNSETNMQSHELDIGSYNPMDIHINELLPISPVVPETAKSRKGKRSKEGNPSTPKKKASKPSKKVKREAGDLNKIRKGDDSKKQVSKSDWKGQDLGLNLVSYDESTMPSPVCSCTGVLRQCYKWGRGGWQSACCTTTMSMYPLPSVPNKRHTRVGGRKMSGGAFNKLLSRLAAEGHDLSKPVDLNNNWAKHGTNRYITIR